MNTAIAARGIITKNEYSNAETHYENKAIILADYNYDYYKEIADYDYAGTICRGLRPEQVPTPFYIAGRVHSRMEGPTTWLYQEGKNYKKKLWDTPARSTTAWQTTQRAPVADVTDAPRPRGVRAAVAPPNALTP
jgi:hypothetical protein